MCPFFFFFFLLWLDCWRRDLNHEVWQFSLLSRLKGPSTGVAHGGGSCPFWPLRSLFILTLPGNSAFLLLQERGWMWKWPQASSGLSWFLVWMKGLCSPPFLSELGLSPLQLQTPVVGASDIHDL